MTIFGWDLSHYDGRITTAVARKARAEGIAFATHKIGEGTGGDDPEDKTALAALRDAGITILGGYHVVRTGPISPQVDALLRLADRDEPWWPDFPGWFWQVDLERWPYDPVKPAVGIAFGEQLAARTGRTVALYASRGQYGDHLSAWTRAHGLLWNADYGSNPHGGFAAAYPGDRSRGWNPYSSRVPDLLQYGSNTTIAGLTTCDANAFRGTLAELTALITGGDDMPTGVDLFNTDCVPNPSWRADSPDHTPKPAKPNPTTQVDFALGDMWERVGSTQLAVAALTAMAAAQGKQITALVATLNTIAGSGTSVDTAAVIAAIDAQGARESDAVTALQQQVAALQDDLAATKAALATALVGAIKDLADADAPTV